MRSPRIARRQVINLYRGNPCTGTQTNVSVCICSPPNGLESHTDGSTQGGEDYQKGLESRQKQRHLAGKRNALCLCAFLSLQLNHAASALHAALDLLEVRAFTRCHVCLQSSDSACSYKAYCAIRDNVSAKPSSLQARIQPPLQQDISDSCTMQN